jgi:hypothetical protein
LGYLLFESRGSHKHPGFMLACLASERLVSADIRVLAERAYLPDHSRTDDDHPFFLPYDRILLEQMVEIKAFGAHGLPDSRLLEYPKADWRCLGGAFGGWHVLEWLFYQRLETEQYFLVFHLLGGKSWNSDIVLRRFEASPIKN